MKIKDLVPNANNPRTIVESRLSMLKKSIAKFGDLSGTIYNRKSKQLVGGHQRNKVFDQNTVITYTKKYSKPTKKGTVAEGYFTIGGEKFPYREVWWDESTEKAANIAANKGAGEWDFPRLGEMLKELGQVDLNFDMDFTMFDADEIEKLTDGIVVKEHTRTGATGVDEDEVPEKPPARTKLGDIYQLGMHRLLCGDSTRLDEVEKLMSGEKADMVFTDPPYGMDLDTDYTSMDSKMGKNTNHAKVIGDGEDFKPELITNIFKSFGYVKEIFIFGADYFAELLPDRNKGSWVIWDKSITDSMDRCFGSAWESCWSKAKHKRTFARILWRGLYGVKDDQKKRVHPTQKPVHLAEWFFDQWGEGLVKIVDLYGGSGSTLIACEKTHRQCYMMELDPNYCDIIVARWEKYTGQKAKLLPRAILKKPKKSK